MGTSAFWTYWYYHLPNFVLAALMYTLLGRALLGLIVQPDDSELHLAVLLPPHRSGGGGGRAGHAEGGRAGRDLAVRRGVAVLAARAAALRVRASPASPRKVELTPHMERHWYYIGIAFFGMVNGMFNPFRVMFVSSSPRC